MGLHIKSTITREGKPVSREIIGPCEPDEKELDMLAKMLWREMEPHLTRSNGAA